MHIQCLLGGPDHVQRTHRTSQENPSTFTQHTWNLFQKTYFYDVSLWINGAWGHKFHGCFSSSTERWWWPDRYYALQSATVFKGSLFAKHRDGVSLCPDANPDMWILKPAQPNLLAFRDAEHLTPEKNQHFHWDIRCVTSSGSHAGKLWPLAISWTITSQPRLILWARQHLQNKEMGYLRDMKHQEPLQQYFLRTTLSWLAVLPY